MTQVLDIIVYLSMKGKTLPYGIIKQIHSKLEDDILPNCHGETINKYLFTGFNNMLNTKDGLKPNGDGIFFTIRTSDMDTAYTDLLKRGNLHVSVNRVYTYL